MSFLALKKVKEAISILTFVCSHMVMNSRNLHLKVSASSAAVRSQFHNWDEAMKNCQFSEKGKSDALL